MVKAIILDLGNVIVPFDFQKCHEELAGACSYSPAQIPLLLSSTDLPKRYESGQISSEDFVREVSGILSLDMTYQRFSEIWCSIFQRETILPDGLLEALGRERRMLLLSNTNAIHFKMIRENYALVRYFDDFILSYEVGALKPSPRIYREAIARSGCRPEECFFTDDIPAYVEAAKREGIDAVRFQSYAQLQMELRNRGVTW